MTSRYAINLPEGKFLSDISQIFDSENISEDYGKLWSKGMEEVYVPYIQRTGEFPNTFIEEVEIILDKLCMKASKLFIKREKYISYLDRLYANDKVCYFAFVLTDWCS